MTGRSVGLMHLTFEGLLLLDDGATLASLEILEGFSVLTLLELDFCMARQLLSPAAPTEEGALSSRLC